MTSYVIDTFAWIEYLDGSPRGIRVRDFVEDSGNTLITSPITIAEIVSKYHRMKRDPSRALVEMEHSSTIPPVDTLTARIAGEIHAELRRSKTDFPLADAFVLATARRRHSKVLTGDPHFKGLPETVMI